MEISMKRKVITRGDCAEEWYLLFKLCYGIGDSSAGTGQLDRGGSAAMSWGCVGKGMEASVCDMPKCLKVGTRPVPTLE